MNYIRQRRKGRYPTFSSPLALLPPAHAPVAKRSCHRTLRSTACRGWWPCDSEQMRGEGVHELTNRPRPGTKMQGQDSTSLSTLNYFEFSVDSSIPGLIPSLIVFLLLLFPSGWCGS